MIKTARTIFILSLLGLVLCTCSSRPENFVILCSGDSMTESPYPRYLQRILSTEGIRAKVYSFGQSGNTSGEYLDYLIKHREAMEALHPDFILLQLGTNDVRVDHDRTPGDRFYRNMKEVISLFGRFTTRKGKGSRLFLALIPPVPDGLPFPFSPESQTRVLEEINPLIARIAEEERIPLVDNFSLFTREPQLLKDVHPTQEGYRKMAQNWYDALSPYTK